jgi:uncharacterized protein
MGNFITEYLPVEGHRDQWIVYRPRLGMAFVGNRSLVAYLRDDSPAKRQQPNVEEFLNSLGYYEPDPPEPPEHDGDFHPTTAVLLMSNQCQLRCTYCYAAAGDFEKEELTFEDGVMAIDQAHDNALARGLSRFEVSFHGGGEPTLAWNVLQRSAAYARNKTLDANLTLTSNGVWSQEKRDWILSNMDGLTLSFDGAPATQDKNRPLVSGEGSTGLVLRTVQQLDQRQFPYAIRMTATPPWSDLVRNVQFICENSLCPVIQIEPSFTPSQRGGHGPGSASDYREFADAFLEAHGLALDAGRYLQYSGARLGVVTTTFCLAPFQALIVGGGGRLTSCYEVTNPTHPLADISTIGRISSKGIELNEAARLLLHGRLRERRETCQGCSAYWSCAGDCYVRVFENRQNGHLAHGPRCDMNRYLLQQLLLRAIAVGNGVWRSHSHARLCGEEPVIAGN